MTARQPARAVVSCRRVRKLAEPGSAVWCRATLDLAKAHVARGRGRVADDVLRVAGALYPDFGNAELLRELKETRTARRRRTPAGKPRGRQEESDRP